jgi:glycosyltransferase involved in cell wall biosynthesis
VRVDRQVRVVHVINTVETGGGAEHLVRLIPGLHAAGFESRVVAGMDGPYAGRLRSLGIPVEVLGEMGPASLAALAHTFRRPRAHLIHLHGSRSGLLGALAGRLTGHDRIVYTAHAFSFKRVLPPVLHAATILAERLTCRLVSRVICLTEEDARAAGRAGITGRPFIVIPNGIDPEPFAKAGDIRPELGFDPTVTVVGMIGRLVPDKDPLTFVRAAALVSRRVSGLRFLVVGEGPLRTAVDREVRTAGLADRFVLTGTRNDIPEVLATVDVVVLTSRWEGLPYVILEAMASGKPIVCSRLPTLASVVPEGVVGTLVEPGDVAGFAEAIATLCGDPSRRRSLGAAAQERVRTEFSLERMISQTAEVYGEVLRAGPSPALGPTRTSSGPPRA